MPYIEECIQSILAQSFQNWRLLILDNRSTDSTDSLCSKYLADRRIEYITNATDIGMIPNFNQCLDLCDTKYYAILSHDDMYADARAVEDSLTLLENDPELCAVYSHLNWIDGNSQTIARKKFKTMGKVASDTIAKTSIRTCRNLFGVPLLVRAAAVKGHKYESAFYFTADIDFSIAIGQGLYHYVIDRPCYAIRFHASNTSMRDFSKTRSELNSIADKHRIKLSVVDSIRMRINDWQTRAGKHLFYLYLDHFRKFMPACQQR
ncbi:glycosyltransferase [Methylomicrobium lacus]|uniref:glycosyltransferase n=1 Tax=Methylomicrobium lacus TaxID=136992 RepID=UPI0035A883A5